MRLIFLWCVLIFGKLANADDLWLIKDTTIISPENNYPLLHQDILISAKGIERIGRSFIVPEAIEIDGRGRYVIPGLIDSHVHLGSYGGVREDMAMKNGDLITQFKSQEPLSYLYFGFTSVVDLKQSEAFVKQWNELAIKPELYY